MKKILFILSSAALVFTACQKEESIVAEAGDFELTATIEQQVDGTDTKTSLSGSSINWTAGDEIMVFDESSNRDKLVAQSGGETSTSFKEPTTKVKDAGFSNTGNHYAIYPYGDGKSCTSSGTITFTLPSSQTYVANSFGQDANVAVASIGTSGTSFYNVCGVLKLQLTGSSKVSKIELRGMKSEKLWGSFSTEVSATPTCVAGERAVGDSVLTLTCPNVQLGNDPTPFYIVVPQGVFKSGFMATVYGDKTSSNLYFGSMSTTNNNQINRSKVRAMGEQSISLDYQKVEYLQSNRTQSINTGFAPNQDTKIEVCFKFLNDLMNNVVFYGATRTWDASSFGFYLGAGRDRYSNYNSDTRINDLFNPSLDTKYVYIHDKTVVYLDGKQLYAHGAQTFQSANNLYLGALGLSESEITYTRSFDGNMYYCSLWDNGTLIRKFIPAVCKSGASYTDGNTGNVVTPSADKPGMFDLVTGKFFVNKGTSTDFTTGPAVTE